MALPSNEEVVPPVTPPNPTSNLPSDNKNKQTETSRTHRTNGGTTGIDRLRPQIGTEMNGEFIQCPFEEHMKRYLPFVPDDADVNACIAQMLKDRGNGEGPIITGTLADEERPASRYFTDFHDLAFTREKWTFSRLAQIAKIIGQSVIDGRTLNFRFYNCPDQVIKSDIEGSTNKIDACFPPIDFSLPQPPTGNSGPALESLDSSFPLIEAHPTVQDGAGKTKTKSDTFVPGINIAHRQPKREHHTVNIPVACEWKLRDTPDKRLKNIEQVVSAMVQVMNDDVRRKFGFGVTIEKNLMRSWFFCRSHSAVSEPVDYVENPALLIKLFMSFMFATKAEMGYDDMIERHDNGRYTYQIPNAEGSRFFRTIDTISEYCSNNITGRMARIWLVEEVTSSAPDATPIMPGRTCVLKDVWLDESASTEREIQDNIFKDIESFFALSSLPADKSELAESKKARQQLVDSKRYKEYFLKIETDYTGDETKQVANGGVRLKGLFDKPLEQPSASKVGTNTARTTHAELHPLLLNSSAQYLDRAYTRKKQYRVVFKENCIAFGKLKTLGEVMDVAVQTLISLQLMFCAGWVHRDISSGNILAYKAREGDPWIAKLSDLEYAKRFPPPEGYEASKDPKTGTPYFMSYEILTKRYLGNIPRRSHAEIAKGHASGPPKPVVHVVHNFQHNLESLWWTILWTLTHRSGHAPAREYANRIFQNQMTLSDARARAFDSSIIVDLTNCLAPDLQGFVSTMDILREMLWSEYIERVEADLLFDANSYSFIYSFFQTTFESMVSQHTGWRNYPLRVHNPETAGKTENRKAPTRITLKRKRSEDSYKPTASENEASESDSNTSKLSYKRGKV